MVNDNKSLLESMSHSLDSTIGFNNNNNNEYAENIKDFYGGAGTDLISSLKRGIHHEKQITAMARSFSKDVELKKMKGEVISDELRAGAQLSLTSQLALYTGYGNTTINGHNGNQALAGFTGGAVGFSERILNPLKRLGGNLTKRES